MSSPNNEEIKTTVDQDITKNFENNNFEPETILVEGVPIEDNDDEDDENFFNINEYTTKCGEIYINDRNRRFHLYCFYCRKEYNNFGLLSEHISEIHFPFNYKRITNRSIELSGLELCGQIFISDMCRFVHICTICKRPYEEYKKILQHYLNDHKNEVSDDMSYLKLDNDKLLQYQMIPEDLIPTKKRKRTTYSTQSTVIKCKYCKREFETENDRKTHACERPWPCEICGKSFKTNWNLIEHTRVHTGEKPFHCDKCDKSFTKSGNLNVHRLTHTEVVPIKCDFCLAVFSQKSTLKSHIRRLHPDADHEFQISRKR